MNTLNSAFSIIVDSSKNRYMPIYGVY